MITSILARAVLLACMGTLSVGATLAQGLTVPQAIDPRGFSSAALSPDGKHIAAVGSLNGSVGMIGVVLIDTETGEASRIVRSELDVGLSSMKIPRSVEWITNGLIAVQYGGVAMSVDLRGYRVAELGVRYVGKVEPENPDSPFVLAYTDYRGRGFARVNALNGKAKAFELPSDSTVVMAKLDKKGELRAVTLSDTSFWKPTTLVSNWYRRADGEWQKLAEFKAADDVWTPIWIPDEEGKLVIGSRHGRDTQAIFSYDVDKREVGELMAGHPTQDIVLASLAVNNSDIRALTTNGIKPQQVWFDARWQAAQASVDDALPGRINRLSGNPEGALLVFSYSDIDPGSWYVADLAKGKLKSALQSKPHIDPSKMRPMETLEYQARDGMRVPAYLTKPGGAAGPKPMVVLVHGGPYVRDRWEWNPEVQLLAARGYAVFQPQFRGSSGFGKRFEQAGFGQWGLAMQDDVTDGVQHLIKAGVADPKRICIYGSSYGGYAALWGLAKTPDLYRCGVSFAGVSDIGDMYFDDSDVNIDYDAMELMRLMVGDVATSKRQFDAVSPQKQAGAIKAPLLLMHGTYDERVPISHSKKMMTALRAAGKPFEWEEFERAGHGLPYVYSARYYERLLNFIDKHIGPAMEPQVAPAAIAGGQ